jgi:hypothetical protein
VKEGFFIRGKNSVTREKKKRSLSCIVKKKSVLLLLRLSERKRGQRRQRRERKVLSIIDPENERERTERDRIEISFSTIYTTLLVEKIKYTNCSFFTEYYKAARILSSRRRE